MASFQLRLKLSADRFTSLYRLVHTLHATLWQMKRHWADLCAIGFAVLRRSICHGHRYTDWDHVTDTERVPLTGTTSRTPVWFHWHIRHIACRQFPRRIKREQFGQHDCNIHTASWHSGDSSVVRAPDSWSTVRGFESQWAERRCRKAVLEERFLCWLIYVSVPPPCYRSSTKDYKYMYL